MPIKSFHIPESEAADIGLKSINMQRLGRVVALAGKNGSGKSRILTKLYKYTLDRAGALPIIEQLNQQILDHQNSAKSEKNPIHVQSYLDEVQNLQQRLDRITGRIISDTDNAFKPIHFVPKSLQLTDPRNRSPVDTFNNYNQAKSPGLTGHEEFCLPYIHHLQLKSWNATHPNQEGPEDEKQTTIADYLSFRNLVSRLLGTDLNRNSDGSPTLYGMPIPESGLSDGQKVLLQLCVAIHAQNSELDNTIFILDELENHLHPSAAIDILQTLYDAAPNSQIWVATHSIALLAYIANIDPMSIWYVDGGMASNAGRYPERVLKTLLGDQDRLEQLNQFTGLPSQLALTTYAAESLLPPQTLTYGSNDPQVSQIRSFITQLANGGPISILDFGAGKGRLLNGLAAELALQGKPISGVINYYAYDPYANDKEVCESIIKSLYTDNLTRYFNSRDEFFSRKEDGSISIAVMCNVLHEIPPQEWLPLFSENSLINRALKDDGYLMIVEDQKIPMGEMAHRLGFIVFNTPHLRTLFSITEQDVIDNKFIENDARGDGRLKAHLISKSLLNRASSATIKKAIEQLLETAKDQIKVLRSGNPSYSNGQLHGFWTQQFANASLYLNEI